MPSSPLLPSFQRADAVAPFAIDHPRERICDEGQTGGWNRLTHSDVDIHVHNRVRIITVRRISHVQPIFGQAGTFRGFQ